MGNMTMEHVIIYLSNIVQTKTVILKEQSFSFIIHIFHIDDRFGLRMCMMIVHDDIYDQFHFIIDMSVTIGDITYLLLLPLMSSQP